MSDEELTKLMDSMQDKLGAENSALIADDLGVLISGNAATQKSLKDKDEEIARLTAHNEKLILANGNLLKQIPVKMKSLRKLLILQMPSTLMVGLNINKEK